MVHTARWAFIDGVDITDISHLAVEAAEIAAQMVKALPDSAVITDWGVLRADGSHYYSAPFGTPLTGTHGTATGETDYYSRTLTASGRGIAPTAVICSGLTRTVLFVGKAFHFTVGEKRFNGAGDSGVTAYLARLNSSTYLPADEYGQHVDLSYSMTVQFNAHTQKREGT